MPGERAVALRFMLIPVIPALILLATLTLLNIREQATSSARVETLRYDAFLLLSPDNYFERAALRLYEQAWQIEKFLSPEGFYFPASYYETARMQAKRGNRPEAIRILRDGIQCIDHCQRNNHLPNITYLLQCEKLRAHATLAEFELAEGKYDEAEKDFDIAISSAPLHKIVRSFSSRVFLQMAGRGWGKCPQCKTPSGDLQPLAVARLRSLLADDDQDFLGTVLDTSRTNEAEYKIWWNVQEKVKEFLNEGQDEKALKRLNRFVNVPNIGSEVAAQRFDRAAELCRLKHFSKRATEYFCKAIALRIASPAPNWVAISEMQRELGDSYWGTSEYDLCLSTTKAAVESARKVTPEDQIILSRAACDLANNFMSLGRTEEVADLIINQSKASRQAMLDGRETADGFLQRATNLAALMTNRGERDKASKMLIDSLELLRSRSSVPVLQVTYALEGILSCALGQDKLATQERIKRLNIAIAAYERFKNMQILPKSESRISECPYLYALAIKEYLTGRFGESIRHSQEALSKAPDHYRDQKMYLLETLFNAQKAIGDQAGQTRSVQLAGDFLNGRPGPGGPREAAERVIKQDPGKR